MSLLITSPATVAAAATHLAGIGSALSTANAAAAAPTTALSVAGADEVSVLIAALFEAYAQEYQALSAQALAFHDQFVQALNMGAVCYAAAETANATPLQALQTVQQNVLTVVNAPTQALLGRPIIGNGANGLPNTGQDGGPGGLLFGNGGNGNRFVVIAVETSQPLPAPSPGKDCSKVTFSGTQLRGGIEVVDVPHIDGTQTLGVHRVLQAVVGGSARTGELYDYSARFGDYQVIVIANPLVIPGRPVARVDTQRARDLLVQAVAAVRG